jgi:uncharacterized protein YjeT (DUF2065 family)
VELGIERLVALLCFVVGVSHIVQPRAWAKLFIDWRDKGDAGVFYTGLLYLGSGAPIIAFHDVWSGWPLVVTLLGWAWTLKAALYLTCPQIAMKSLARISFDRAHEFVIAGAALVLIAAVITYSLATRGEL